MQFVNFCNRSKHINFSVLKNDKITENVTITESTDNTCKYKNVSITTCKYLLHASI